MSKILAVGSPKGGVGKTTAAVTLAALAARELKLRVLLVDADANHSAMDWTSRAGEDSMPFDVASGAGEAAAELAQLRKGRRYDLTVVDLPGAREGAFTTILRGGGGRPVADLLLVPVRAELMDLRPVVRVVRTEVIPLGLPYLIALTMVDTVSLGRARQRQTELTGQEHRFSVADTIIRDYSVYDEALETNRTILDIGGRHSYARVAEAEYRALGAELFPTLGFDATPLQEAR